MLTVSLLLALVTISLAAPSPGAELEDGSSQYHAGRIRRHYDGGLGGYGGGYGGGGFGAGGLGHHGHPGHGGHGLGGQAFPIGSSQSYSKSSASASSVSGSGGVLG